jgi:uncharacterized protein with von Willebrand factor type A (vWA) domain
MQKPKIPMERIEGISGPGTSLPFNNTFNPSTILNFELREVLATPRKIPRHFREEIAEILVYELFSEKGYEIKDEKLFMRKFGVFYPIFMTMRSLENWVEIKTLARTNNMAGVFILRTLLEELFSMIEDFERLEYEFSKKFPKTLEKTLKALKNLINETQMTWEKRRSEGMNTDFQWQAKQNIPLKEPIIEENPQKDIEAQEREKEIEETEKWEKIEEQEKQENKERREKQEKQEKEKKEEKQSDFLRYSAYETLKDAEQQFEGLMDSEKLASMTEEFISSEKAWEIVDSVIGERIAAKIEKLIPVLEDHLEMLEILSMLFPGKIWDYSLQALHREYFTNLEKYAAILRKSSGIQKILEQVGRIELEYGSKKSNLSPYSKSEVHSVTMSSEIQTLLPVEAVKLKNPLLKRKFYADMLEGKLLTYQLKGENWNSNAAGKKRKGPVVALVDTSASMRGIPETLAKAVILAVARKMLKEGRNVKVILFSSKWQTFEIELTDKKHMAEEFLEFLKFTFGGGTDFNTALRAGLKTMKAEKSFEGADLLFLTDGASELSEKPLIREWNEIKAERKARIFSLIIGNYDAGGLEQVSDRTYIIRNADNWDIGQSPASFVKALSRPSRF